MEINNNEKIAPFIAILDTYLEKLSSLHHGLKIKFKIPKMMQMRLAMII